MIKKILVMVVSAIALLPAIVNKLQAQNYATETVEREDGRIEHWEERDFALRPEWVLVSVEYPDGGGRDIEWRDHDEEDLPDDDWGYPDWSDLMEWLDHLDDMQREPLDGPSTGGTAENHSPFYCITSSSDRHRIRYFTGSQITVVAKANATISLVTYWSRNAPITGSQINWKRNNTMQCQQSHMCNVSIATPGTYTIDVMGPQSELVSVKLVVLDKSMVKFHRKDNYDSEYGFDEEGFQFATLGPVSNYEKITVSGHDYQVPWMSILDGQEAEVKIEPLISAADRSDPNFKLTFTSTHPNIKIVNASQYQNMSLASLNGFNNIIRIEGEELDPNIDNHAEASIEVKTNTGALIGKIKISCQKPKQRKLVLVYVKTHTPYRNETTSERPFLKDVFLDRLNKNAHNQIFKEWIEETNYPTALDLTEEYDANSSDLLMYDSPEAVLRKLVTYYKNKTGVDWVEINRGKNGPDRTYFHLITDLPNKNGGVAYAVGSPLSCIFQKSSYITSIHELGHNLNLAHTFQVRLNPTTSEAFGPGIPIKATSAFMDYSSFTNMFFYYQWPKSY